MKKILTFAFIFVLSLTLVACSGGGDGDCSHKDNDNNHLCDFCDEELTKCKDKNSDHECDTCGKELSACKDRPCSFSVSPDEHISSIAVKNCSCISADPLGFTLSLFKNHKTPHTAAAISRTTHGIIISSFFFTS